MNFFVMMNNHKGDLIMPLVDDDQNVMLWATADEARDAADANPFASHFGFEIFERGTGSY